MDTRKKYIVFTYSPTGNCWVTYINDFQTKRQAIDYARNHGGGQIIKTEYFEKVESNQSKI